MECGYSIKQIKKCHGSNEITRIAAIVTGLGTSIYKVHNPHDNL